MDDRRKGNINMHPRGKGSVNWKWMELVQELWPLAGFTNSDIESLEHCKTGKSLKVLFRYVGSYVITHRTAVACNDLQNARQ